MVIFDMINVVIGKGTATFNQFNSWIGTGRKMACS